MTSPTTQPVSRRAAIPLVGLGAAVAALATVAALLWPAVWRDHRDQARDQAVLATARQTVTTLLTVDRADPRATLDRLRAGSTGAFTQQLVSESDRFTQAVTGANATSTASISEAGIRSASEGEAAVLVSATSVVTNERLPGGGPRQYRVLVELRHTGSAWLVSNVEFLP